MDFPRINKAFDFDDFSALELNLSNIFRRHNHILFRLELVTFDNFFRRERLAAFLAFFLVTHGPIVRFVQLIEPDCFLCIHSVVNPDGNGDERKLDVTFPYRSHNLPRLGMLNCASEMPVVWAWLFMLLLCDTCLE